MTWIIPTLLPPEYQRIDVIDVSQSLPINPKGGWLDFKPKRNIDELTTIVLHHDGMSKASTQKYSDMQLMTNIANAHIRSTKHRSTGDGGFPYHAFIRSGKVYLTNPYAAFTYGVASHNYYTIHISVAGEYARQDTLTEDDRKALLLAILIVKATMTRFKYIKGHRDMQATSCPGYSVPNIINDVTMLEHRIEQMKSPQDQAERAYQMANQFLYLYNMFAKGTTHTDEPATEGQRKWALEQVLKLEPDMKKHNLIK